MDLKIISLSPPDAKNNLPLKLFHRHPSAQSRPFSEHRHLEFEIGYFKSGKGRYKTYSREYTIKPGDIFIFRSNEIHWISEIAADEPMEIMNMHFEPRLLWSSYDIFYVPESLRLFTDNTVKTFCNRIDRDNPFHSDLKNILLSIENEMQNKRQEYSLMVRNNILAFFVLLIRHFGYNSEDGTKSSFRNSAEAIEHSMDYIQTHLNENLKLNDIAAVANFSETYYSSVFKKLNGISPWDYIISKRIELAISYLCNSKNTMLDIALKCGFKNTANFNRTFKKITGKTPSEYRRKKQPIID